MFCYQCEQTENNTGCTTIGVCGKTPEVAALQDMLIHCMKGISQYWSRVRKMTGVESKEIDDFMLAGIFATLTNVNFDPDRFVEYLKQAEALRDKAKAAYVKACEEKKIQPESFRHAEFKFPGYDEKSLLAEAKKHGVEDRKAKYGEDYVGVQELIVYGLKGTCAYYEHSRRLGQNDPAIMECIYNSLNALTDDSLKLDDLFAIALDVGKCNLRTMELLDNGHVTELGHPVPTQVSTVPKPGKAILVSGHDMRDLQDILEQTKGKGINVYTHGEMLNAHGYPELKKHPHLAGHFGGPWQLQKMDFAAFPGAILMTSNCLIEPRKSYKDRIFTTSVVGWPGVKHIKSHDFSELIQSALDSPGFTEEDAAHKPSFLTTGYARNAILSQADKVIDGIQKGRISRFFVVGGCDGSEGERSYFTDVAKQAPKDSIMLTMGCGKYRINRLDLGDIDGIPRVLDMGQCNDAYSGIQIALTLAKHFKTDVNKLPLSFAISWFEQKAVAVFLTMLYLNIQNIRLGPRLPAFATPNILALLQEKFQLKGTGDINADMPKMLQNQ